MTGTVICEVCRCKKDGFWIVKKDIGKALFRRGREQAHLSIKRQERNEEIEVEIIENLHQKRQSL